MIRPAAPGLIAITCRTGGTFYARLLEAAHAIDPRIETMVLALSSGEAVGVHGRIRADQQHVAGVRGSGVFTSRAFEGSHCERPVRAAQQP